MKCKTMVSSVAAATLAFGLTACGPGGPGAGQSLSPTGAVSITTATAAFNSSAFYGTWTPEVQPACTAGFAYNPAYYLLLRQPDGHRDGIIADRQESGLHGFLVCPSRRDLQRQLYPAVERRHTQRYFKRRPNGPDLLLQCQQHWRRFGDHRDQSPRWNPVQLGRSQSGLAERSPHLSWGSDFPQGGQRLPHGAFANRLLRIVALTTQGRRAVARTLRQAIVSVFTVGSQVTIYG